VKFTRNDFGTAPSRSLIVIFFLTSLFNDSIHQLVAVKDRCTFSMMNGQGRIETMATKKKAKKKKKH
jgi:hypothetical protein